MPDGWTGALWCPSAAARVGDTSGKSERLGNERGAAGWLAVDRLADSVELPPVVAAGLRLVLLALSAERLRARSAV